MRALGPRTTTPCDNCAAVRPDGRMLRTMGVIALATAAFVQAWSGTAHGWTIEVNTPTITITTPTITPPTIATPNVNAITHSVEQAVSNVQAHVGAVTAGIANLPAAASVNAAQIAANVTANVDTAVRNVTAATNRATASINSQGLGALVSPGLAAASAVQLRTEVVTLARGPAVTVDFYGDGLINFAVNDAAARSIGNSGAITIASADASNIVDQAINLNGIAHSQALTIHDGQVTLIAGLAPGAGAHAPTVHHQNPGNPLVVILADPSFRPGGYDVVGRAAGGRTNGHESQHGPSPVWTDATEAFFGTVATLTESGLEGEQQAEAQTAVTVLNQLDTLVSKERLAPADVCQMAGGGGVGLPGCAASETFGAEVTLAPEATGAGCALISAGGGIRLSCGGASGGLPSGDGNNFGLPGSTVNDPSQTIQDLLDEWLRQPMVTDGPFVASRDAAFDQVAAATDERGARWY